MTINDNIYREIAKQMDMHPDDIEKICRSQFSYVVSAMESNKFIPVRLPYFGIFMCKERRLEKLGIKKQQDGN